jgi:hypothetical protein
MPNAGQPETTETETPAEGAAAGEGATDEAAQAAAAAAEGGEQAGGGTDATADEQAALGEPAAEKTPEELAAEKAKADEAEVAVKTAAEKYAKDQIAQANRTMAAARRAEKAVADTKAENAKLTEHITQYQGFVQQLRTDPLAALARVGVGDGTVKSVLQHVVDSGGEKTQTEEERIDALVKKRLDEREAPRTKAEQERAVAESQRAVFAFVDEHKADKYARTATRAGKRELWDAITTYVDKHGTCPDEAVEFLADAVEREMRADFGDPISPSPGAKQGTKPATGAAAPGASTSGKTIAGKPMSGAPAVKKYSDDPDERTRQINAELKAEGLL